MTIEIETIDSCNKKIKIDIPHQDYMKRVDAQYVKVGQNVQLPGFRKGKVPKTILEKRFGPEVKREVLTQLISERLADAIEEKGIKAVSPPSLLDVHAEEGTDINVSASIEVLPDIAIKDYTGIELGLKINRVTGKEVEDVVAHYRQRAAKNVPVTGRPAQDKDFVKIDFQGTVDGQPVSGGEAKDFILQIGSKESFVEFNAGVTGMRIGEEKTIQIGYPGEYGNPELAGKTADYRVVLKGIQVQELPALDQRLKPFGVHKEVMDSVFFVGAGGAGRMRYRETKSGDGFQHGFDERRLARAGRTRHDDQVPELGDVIQRFGSARGASRCQLSW